MQYIPIASQNFKLTKAFVRTEKFDCKTKQYLNSGLKALLQYEGLHSEQSLPIHSVNKRTHTVKHSCLSYFIFDNLLLT